MVRFPEATIYRAESSAKTWRERSDFSSCDRLDREETGAGVSESFCHAKHGRCLYPYNALSHGSSLRIQPPEGPTCGGCGPAVIGAGLVFPVLGNGAQGLGFSATIWAVALAFPGVTASALCLPGPTPPSSVQTACCKALTRQRKLEESSVDPEITGDSHHGFSTSFFVAAKEHMKSKAAQLKGFPLPPDASKAFPQAASAVECSLTYSL